MRDPLLTVITKQLFPNLIGLYWIQALNVLLPALSLPFVLKAIGIEKFGLVSFYLSISMMLVMAVDAGLPQTALRLMSKVQHHRRRPSRTIQRIFYATQQVRAIFSLILMSITVAIAFSIPMTQEHRVMLLLGMLNVLGTLSLPAYYFVATQQSHVLAICHLAGRGPIALIQIFCIHDPSQAVLVMFLNSIATLFSGGVAHFYLRRFNLGSIKQYLALNQRQCVFMLRSSGHLIPTQYCQAIIANAPTVLLGVFQSKANAGTYAAIEKIARIGIAFLEPITAAVLPILAQRSGTATKQRSRVTLIVCCVAIVSASFLAIAAALIAKYLLGDESQETLSMLQLMSMWMCLTAINRHLEVTYFLSLNRLDQHKKIVTLLFPLSIALLLLTAQHSALYVAIAMISVEVVQLIASSNAIYRMAIKK